MCVALLNGLGYSHHAWPYSYYHVLATLTKLIPLTPLTTLTTLITLTTLTTLTTLGSACLMVVNYV